MENNLLTLLGRAASFSRAMKLGFFLEWSRDALDTVFIRLGTPPLRVTIGGMEVTGFLRHRSFLDYLSTGRYEPFTKELFQKNLKPGTVFVDGGAHIGCYSLLACQLLGATGRVIAFEPDPHNFAALLSNIKRNHCRNIQPIRKALSNQIQPIAFYQSSGTIGSSVIVRRPNGTVRKIVVLSTTLDKEMEGEVLRDLVIKLDLEGGEIFALQGMRGVLSRSERAVVFSEINPSALSDGGLTPQDIAAELRDLHFEVFYIDEMSRTLLPISEETINRKGNLFCTKGGDV